MANTPRRQFNPGPKPSQRFCVYEHIRSDTNTCFWVGKGTLKRAHSTQRGRGHSVFYDRIVKKLLRTGFDVQVNIVKDKLTEPEAFALEILQIAKYGRRNNVTGILANLTDGGEGPSGLVFSAASRKKMSAKLRENQANGGYTKGRKCPDEERAKIVAVWDRLPQEEKDKRSARLGEVSRQSQRNGGHTKGRTLSAEHKAKLAIALIGNKNGVGWVPTDEQRVKMSKVGKDKPKRPKHRAKLQKLCRDRNKTPAMRQATAERNKQRALAKRQQLMAA